MYTTIEQFTNFTGTEFEIIDENSLPYTCLKAAEEMVENYLHYSPEKKTYTTTFRGEGTSIISLEAPILSLQSFSEGELADFDFEINDNHITIWSGMCRGTFKDGKKYTFVYDGGFDEIPESIIMCTLQIASLFYESHGGNLAVNSTSFADTGTRVFNNFKADRFLEQINDYRIYK